MEKRVKTAKTLKEYKTNFWGWEITVPVGSTVTNKTASGPDDNYRFWLDFRKVAAEVTGTKGFSTLVHDLEYRGLNIPAEYCEPYASNDQVIKKQHLPTKPDFRKGGTQTIDHYGKSVEVTYLGKCPVTGCRLYSLPGAVWLEHQAAELVASEYTSENGRAYEGPTVLYSWMASNDESQYKRAVAYAKKQWREVEASNTEAMQRDDLQKQEAQEYLTQERARINAMKAEKAISGDIDVIEITEDSFFNRAQKNIPTRIIGRKWHNGTLLYYVIFGRDAASL